MMCPWGEPLALKLIALMSCPYISGFSYVGVRDEVTRRELLNQLKTEIYSNCDPTILGADMFRKGKDEIEGIKKKIGLTEEKPVIAIMISDSAISRHLYRMLRNENMVVCTYEMADATDVMAFAFSPFEWSNLIAAADMVITDLFHGTIFSMIHNIPFISIEKEKSQRGKISNILVEYNLLENLICKEDYKNSSSLVLEIYTKCRWILESKEQVDYSSIFDKERIKSKTFYTFLDRIIYGGSEDTSNVML